MSVCTRDVWHVSSHSGHGIDGAILNVWRDRGPGDHDKRRFPSSDAAHAFALERGYCQIHHMPETAERRAHRRWTRQMGRAIPLFLQECHDARAIYALSDSYLAAALDRGFSLANGRRMQQGVIWAARKLHPALMRTRGANSSKTD
jgi:hypothetical protein